MFTLILLALSFLIFVRVLLSLKQRYSFVKLINRIPGPTGYPLIGSALEIRNVPKNKRVEQLEAYMNKYGPLFKVWLGWRPVVSITTPEHAEVILASTVNTHKSFAYEFFEDWLGTGLLTASGKKWHQRRKLLTPAFHFSRTHMDLSVIVENCKIFTDILENKVNSAEFDIFPYVNNCALDVICETAMGVKVNAQKETSEYVRCIKKINEIIIQRLLRPWLWPRLMHSVSENYRSLKQTLNVLHGFTQGVIEKRKLQRKMNKLNDSQECDAAEMKKRTAFLDLILNASEQSNNPLSNEDVREEVDTFMFEGHDTTSSAVSWAIYYLGANPDVQEKVYEELLSVFGTSDRPPTREDLAELKYLECVIKESLRLCPAVPHIARTLTEDVTLDGYLLPRGIMVDVQIYHIQRQPKHFPNPNKFNPDNFSKENAAKRHPFAFVPFSAGPRNCIGQKFAMLEEKVILSSLFRKYKIMSTQKEEELQVVPEAILRSDNGIMIRIEKRTFNSNHTSVDA